MSTRFNSGLVLPGKNRSEFLYYDGIRTRQIVRFNKNKQQGLDRSKEPNVQRVKGQNRRKVFA
jgi:hypothetical protein